MKLPTLLDFPEEPFVGIKERVREHGLTADVDDEHCQRWWVAVCTWVVILRYNSDLLVQHDPKKMDARHCEWIIWKLCGFVDKLYWLLHTFYQTPLVKAKKNPPKYKTNPSELEQVRLIPKWIKAQLWAEGPLSRTRLQVIRTARNHATHGLDLVFREEPKILFAGGPWEGYVNLVSRNEIVQALNEPLAAVTNTSIDKWQEELFATIPLLPEESVHSLRDFEVSHWLGGGS